MKDTALKKHDHAIWSPKARISDSPKRREQLLQKLIDFSSFSNDPLSPDAEKRTNVDVLFCGIGDAQAHKLHASSLTTACQARIDNTNNSSLVTTCQVYESSAALIRGITEHRPTILHITCFDHHRCKRLVQDLVVHDDEFLSAIRGRSFADRSVRMVVLDMHMADIVAGVLIPQLEFVVINSPSHQNSLRALQELYSSISVGMSVHQSHCDASSFAPALRLAGTSDPRQVLCPAPNAQARRPPLPRSSANPSFSPDDKRRAASSPSSHQSSEHEHVAHRTRPSHELVASRTKVGTFDRCASHGDVPRNRNANDANAPKLLFSQSLPAKLLRRLAIDSESAAPPTRVLFPERKSESESEKEAGRCAERETRHGPGKQAGEGARRELGTEEAAAMRALEEEVAGLKAAGEREAALERLQALLAVQRAALGSRHEATARTQTAAGELLSELGWHREAEEHLVEALRARRSVEGRESLAAFEALNNLAVVLERQGRYKEALRRYHESLRVSRACPRVAKEAVASLLYNMAALYTSLRMWEEVCAFNHACYLLRCESLGEEHALTGAAKRWWTRAMEKVEEGRVWRIIEEGDEEEQAAEDSRQDGGV